MNIMPSKTAPNEFISVRFDIKLVKKFINPPKVNNKIKIKLEIEDINWNFYFEIL